MEAVALDGAAEKEATVSNSSTRGAIRTKNGVDAIIERLQSALDGESGGAPLVANLFVDFG